MNYQDYIRIPLTKCTVYLKPSEIHSLLLQNMDLYREALIRGKKLERFESKREQFEAKWAGHEGDKLDELMQ